MTNEVTTSPPPSLAVDAWNELDDPVTIIDEAFRPMLCNAAFHEWTHGSGTAPELRDGAGGYLLALGRVFADEAVSRVSRAVKSVLAGEVVDDTLVIETTASGPSTTEIIRVRIRQSRAFPGPPIPALARAAAHARATRGPASRAAMGSVVGASMPASAANLQWRRESLRHATIRGPCGL